MALKHDADKRRGNEVDSGVARTQRLLHDGQHLRASGLQFQAVLGGGDADGTGFEVPIGIKKAPPDGHQTEFGGSGGIRFSPTGSVGAGSDAPLERHSLPALRIPPIGNATPRGGVWRKRWDSILACGLGRGRL